MILYSETRYLPQPKSIHLLKPKSTRLHFPILSPRSLGLLLKPVAPCKPQHKSQITKEETSLRIQNENLQKLKKLFEKIINKPSSEPIKPLPTIPKSPLRNKSIETIKKTSKKIVLSSNKRSQIPKPLITRNKEKKSKPIFSLNTLKALSRSFSKNSFEKSFKLNKEENEKSGRIDRRIKSRMMQKDKEKEKEIWEEMQKDEGVAGLILNGNSRVCGNLKAGIGLSARDSGFVSAGARVRDFACFFRTEVADKGRKDELSESDEDRIDVYDDFLYF